MNIGVFFHGLGRPFVASVQSSRRIEKEAKESEAEKNLREADCKSALLKIEADMAMLKGYFPDETEAALKNAKDLKYLRDRQQILVLNCSPRRRFSCLGNRAHDELRV